MMIPLADKWLVVFDFQKVVKKDIISIEEVE